ncbi:hypothetical protein SPRG_06872 [Saprolegnia parasitica CBS 223.65]|uniref:Aspartyl/asparaginy/proline hydroxylase domain-containing protein n=1 Tax=Saprolegnia parasitica (strain CBS 223.65) TaxID=695850 RepID=A0A067CA18_SAPPC|nr:hypothetical protein SPRG_06872 [Saprolegnia parasitica CBS 223.65]KDO27604.1 hypothetical protein SPRG_06872 [Saprolegnia parasitica CBS 223.65]|eukprot:XP_012201726.1 hypothetical protein SPRG_06872 [Saprolegnia parasitica CBS 223.65]
MRDYDGYYGSDAVAKGYLPYCNIGLHDSDAKLMHDVPQAHNAHLYHGLLKLSPVADAISHHTHRLHVLDVGCGTGAGLHVIQKTLEAWTSSPITTVGVDKCASAVKAHKKLYGGKPKVLQYDVEGRMTAFARAKFDLVTAVQSLQECTPSALTELSRVLKPQGLLLVADFVNPRQPFDCLHALQSHADFRLLEHRDVSFSATIAAKSSSTGLRAVLNECVSDAALRAAMAEMLTLKKTPQYEDVRLGALQYGLFCFEYVPSTPVPDVLPPVDNALTDDSSDNDDDDDDDDDIDDKCNPSYYDYSEVFPQLELLRSHYETIRDEALKAQLAHDWPNWPEDHYIGEDGEWRVFPLCYTFPAWDASKTTWVHGTCAQCPATVALLQAIPGIRTALFSKLGPETTLGAHRGWADLANDILRCHIGLDVPTYDGDDATCCIVVDGEPRAQANGRVLVFDDSKLHFAFNRHPTAARCILIVDLYRPAHLPRGMARGGHTDELDAFIAQYNAAMNP